MRSLFNLSFLILLFSLISACAKNHNNADLVRTSCAHASYPKICLRTLSSYSGVATTLRNLARAGVKVSLSRSKAAANFLAQLKSQSKREQIALRDCIELMGNSMDELTETLSELQHLRSGDFGWHMSNVETWVSAALTNENTCLDGFKEIEGFIRSDVKRKITKVARVTSNALYLIDLLDNSHGKNVEIATRQN
ncbi:pectinesterase inhibitor 3-like [Olea europaea var. sylvestris]|uniref:21 kDa -like n=1 Tax=Olea europaea subsp. europaea TaxID=158383 RepID=A0A8S0QD17_OLEEU|nr:pectinesterase inhibitor 3-like [Olea europaea var. sylvestris]CAA2965613.1 21 kDa -like [Olea europaea subsp. europaea]